jgi:hypothetical protein
VAAAPILWTAGGHSPAVSPLAQCPPGQTLDVLTGTCSPDVQAPEPVANPINPEEAQLQPGSITSSETGEVGRLPEVNGIPCNGDNTGLCIGLTEVNEQLGVAN